MSTPLPWRLLHTNFHILFNEFTTGTFDVVDYSDVINAAKDESDFNIQITIRL